MKGGLAFSKSSGKMVRFCDLGAVNNELVELCAHLSRDNDKPVKLASHMLVFMVRPVCSTFTVFHSCYVPDK